jgi:hypothetical protein
VVRNKEISIYGLTLAGSGFSQIVASQLSGTLPVFLGEYVGIGFLLIGALIFAIAFFWKREPSEKPLGITLLALSYAFLGLLFILLGGWFFTPLFLVGLVCFLLSYGLLARKSWALFIVQVSLMIGFLVSLVGIGNEGVANVAGILTSCYVTWYINREHVTGYFKSQSMMPKLSRRSLNATLVVFLLFFLPIGYFQYNPPSSVVASGQTSGSGGPGGVLYTFVKGDLVQCTFQVVQGYSPVKVTIQSLEGYGTVGIVASDAGMSGSAVGTVPSTGKYIVWVGTSNEMYYKIDYEIIVAQNSLRRMTPQWALLDIYAVIAILSAIQARKSVPLEASPA